MGLAIRRPTKPNLNRIRQTMSGLGKKDRLFIAALSVLIAAAAISAWSYTAIRADLTATQAELSRANALLILKDADIEEMKTEHAETLAELEQSLGVPYTSISGREITWAWQDTAGKLHRWKLPLDTYRSWIEKPKPQGTVSLRDEDISYTLTDFRPFVSTEGFTKVVPALYEESADEMAFAREAFHLVSQLTVYSEDIGEVARWPVETLTEAGGDCEDLAILYASLLKASPYPYNLSLVYMDSANPTDPQRPNHIIIRVEAEGWMTYVDCTADWGWGRYQTVKGWFYKL